MSRTLGLRARLIVASALLVTTTVAASVWSAWSFRRVSRVVGVAVTDSELTTDATGDLAGALEREDDAVLLALTDPARGRTEIARARHNVADALARVMPLLTEPEERAMGAHLLTSIAAYRAAADSLVAIGLSPDTRARYHDAVNPLLRSAVAVTERIRDKHFRSSQDAAAWARDQSTSSMQIVAAISLAALLLSALVVFHLARVVMTPLGEMTRAVAAFRGGDFDRRIKVGRDDELGRLARDLDRMADDLAAFRRANIGEVIRAKETLEATLAALPDAVVVLGPDGTIIATNPRAAELVRTRAAVSESLRAAASGEAPVDLARSIELPVHGRARRFLARTVPVEGPDGAEGAVLVLSDVTELVRLDEMRLELVAVASHELRTPLTTLRMTLLMLQESAAGLDARVRELIATALVGTDQLGVLIGEFLDLTQIEAGQLRLRWDLVPLGEIVEQCTRAIAASCDDASVRLAVEVAPDLPRTIVGDRARLVTVLSNLLSNAVKYSRAGGRIQVRATAGDGGAVRLEVADQGPGVPAELRERIFEKFFRVEHDRPEASGVRGAGIGLYIARQIVEAHGGTIVCETGDGGAGSRFVVRLPATRPIEEPAPGDQSAAAPSSRP